MIIYVAWPTCNVPRSNRTAEAWMAAGYKVAVTTELPRAAIAGLKASVPPLLSDKYDGYYTAMNALTMGLAHAYRADVVICGGDGLMPDPSRRGHDAAINFAARFKNGFGVMQPIGGERWKPTARGQGTQAWAQHLMHATPRVDERCESPWLGRTFILEANGGEGPYARGYKQYFGDVELHDVAQEMGVLWKREDFMQEHRHWSRPGGPTIEPYQVQNFEREYEKDLALYRARKAKGFPGAVVADMGLGVNKNRKLILPEGY